MVEVGNIRIKLGINSTLNTDVSKAGGALEKLRANAKKTTSDFKTLNASLVDTSKSLSLKISAPILALGAVMTKGGEDIEDYRTVLTNLYGDEVRAGKALSQLQQFNDKTPFELPGIMDAAVKLQAYGIAWEDTLRTVGDASAGMGKPLMQGVEALADAQTGEFERMKEFGIKAVELTKSNAEALGASLGDVGRTALTYTDKAGNQTLQVVDRNNRAMVQSTILAIWNEKYAGAMDQLSQNMTGIWSNIKDNITKASLSALGWNQQLGKFGENSAFEKIKSFAASVRDVTAGIAGMDARILQAGAVLAGLAAVLIPLPFVVAGLSAAWGVAAGAMTATIIPALGAVIPLLSTVGLPVIALAGGLYILEKKFGTVTTGITFFKDTLTIGLDVVKKAGIVIKDYLAEKLEKVKETIAKVTEGFASLFEFLEPLGGDLGGKIGEALDNWHEKAEAIRQANQGVTAGIKEQKSALDTLYSTTPPDAAGAGGTGGNIPDYAGKRASYEMIMGVDAAKNAGLAGWYGSAGQPTTTTGAEQTAVTMAAVTPAAPTQGKQDSIELGKISDILKQITDRVQETKLDIVKTLKEEPRKIEIETTVINNVADIKELTRKIEQAGRTSVM
ncbi:hypothetical protein FTO70_14340 [Methanosarcina sp. KYL-1]|uniref:hypothetical protein n=1 Tax=Methanosarcina sp. KYL-1 TaxID=2602068 RepID=UPI0021011A0D|nr:hypothetical protein [Methanosarcina sp. KYL-1]MCQ1536829.1 hypothetical protein [Methanosarcina sp. KYL-1]